MKRIVNIMVLCVALTGLIRNLAYTQDSEPPWLLIGGGISKMWTTRGGTIEDADVYFVSSGHDRTFASLGIRYAVVRNECFFFDISIQTFKASLENFDRSGIGIIKGAVMSISPVYVMGQSSHFFWCVSPGAISIYMGNAKPDPGLYFNDEESGFLYRVRDIRVNTTLGFTLLTAGGYYKVLEHFCVGLETSLIESNTPKVVFETFISGKSFEREVFTSYGLLPIRLLAKFFL
jgi:hypothetical protein